MMTHKTATLIFIRDETTSTKATLLEVISSDPEMKLSDHFSVGEVVYRREFKDFEPGQHVKVLVRINLDSTSMRRYYLSFIGLDESIEPTSLLGIEKDVDSSAKIDDDPLIGPATNLKDSSKKSDESPFVGPNNFYVSPTHREVFSAVTGMLSFDPKTSVKVMMVGRAGYGKTSLGYEYARSNNMSIIRQDCGSIRDPEEWFGYREAVDGTTVFVRSPMMKMLEDGNCVIILDEINRVEPSLHNAIYHLLEPNAKPIIHGEQFTVGENVVFIMTINVGFEHSGTFTLDNALLSRVDIFCEVGPLPASVEKNLLITAFDIESIYAGNIVETLTKIRELDFVECSTRTSLQVGRLVKAGLPIRSAIEHAVVNRVKADALTVDHLKSLLDTVNARLGPYKPPMPSDLTADPFSNSKKF